MKKIWFLLYNLDQSGFILRNQKPKETKKNNVFQTGLNMPRSK